MRALVARSHGVRDSVAGEVAVAVDAASTVFARLVAVAGAVIFFW